MIDHTIMDFTGEFYSDEPQTVLSTLEHFFCFWHSQKRLLDALDHSGLTGVLLQRSVVKATEEDLLPKQLFYVRPHISNHYIIYFLISGLLSMVFLWYRNGFQESERQLALAASQLITHPLVSPVPNR